jgi:hypothetical protein
VYSSACSSRLDSYYDSFPASTSVLLATPLQLSNVAKVASQFSLTSVNLSMLRQSRNSASIPCATPSQRTRSCTISTSSIRSLVTVESSQLSLPFAPSSASHMLECLMNAIYTTRTIRRVWKHGMEYLSSTNSRFEGMIK